ncbi:serine hydrolase domain-containing protein [Bacteroidota bacterium]
MKKSVKYFMSILFSFIMVIFVSCRDEATLQQKNDITGVWVANIEDEFGKQAFLFVLNCVERELSGEVHTYIGNTKLERMKFGKVEYYPPRINIVTNPMANIVYEADIDIDNESMKGELIYNNGSKRNMMLTRYGGEQLKDEYPGIADYLADDKYKYESPKLLNDGIIVSSLNAEGIDNDLLYEMVEGIFNGDFGVVNSVLIMKDSKLLFEKYFGGYHYGDMHALRSVTKSIASLCVGIAYDQGKIKSLDERVVNFFPEYSKLQNDDWDRITIEHLLTMSMGLDWGEGLEDEVHTRSKNIIKDVLSRPAKLTPGEKWEYINPNVNLTAGVVKYSTGLHADELADRFLFAPLGISEYDWSWDKQNGYPRMDGSLCLCPRDMAKIGLMMINKGKYNGKQVISEEWIEKSMKHQITIDDIFSYGYLWWRAKSHFSPDTEIIFANGLGGQHIIIVPKFDLVVVTTGGNYSLDKMKLIMTMVDSYIINMFAAVDK